MRERIGRRAADAGPARVSGFLIEIAPGATELQVRFALLSRLSGIKVVAGETLLTGIRQGLEALLDGTLALVAMTFVQHGHHGLRAVLGDRRGAAQ